MASPLPIPLPAETFADKLLAWYRHHHRRLPWRSTHDPYKIWLSEIILQQTKVAQGLAYYERLVAHYPTVDQLAKASEEEVLRLWQGLGYYTRARNLHKCARYVAFQLQGRFPTNYQSLLQLPGVGPYTAAAIASIAFGEEVPVLDGNVYRVLARVFGKETNVLAPNARKAFLPLAQSLMPAGSAGVYNQAIMEFGALHCTPQRPQCSSCIFRKDCAAHQQGLQSALPVRTKPPASKERYFHYVVFYSDTHLYLTKRETKDIWRSLYHFHLVELPNAAAAPNFTALGVPPSLSVEPHPQCYTHQLTHQRLHVRFWLVKLAAPVGKTTAEKFLNSAGLVPYTYATAERLPFPILLARFYRNHLAPTSPPTKDTKEVISNQPRRHGVGYSAWIKGT